MRIWMAAAAALLAGCRKESVKPAAAPEPAPVQAAVMRIQPEAFTATVAVTGTLVSRTQVDIKAQTTGRVVRFDKEEGDPVTAGEVVLWVEEDNYRLSLAQAESAVKVAEAALEKTRVLEAHARAELERAENLLQSGGITDRDLKAARVNEQDARAQVVLAAAQLDQTRATVNVARKHLVDTQVRAPVAGEIQKKFVNKGAYVEPATAVFSMVDNHRLELESQVATAELGPVRRGQPVTFRINSYPGETFAGTVLEILPAVDAETRSAKVRIQVKNAGKLRAGMFAQGEILTHVEKRAIVLPLAALYRDDSSAKDSFVFTVESGVAKRRQVRIGREREGAVEIVEGLRPGEQVVVEQSIEIAEGVKVVGK